MKRLGIVRRLVGCFYCGQPCRGDVCRYCSDLPLKDPLVARARLPLSEQERIEAAQVPDGPPIRRPGCDKECVTRWDQEPRHTAACDQRYREAVERVDAGQREYDEQMRRYIEFKARSEAERIEAQG